MRHLYQIKVGSTVLAAVALWATGGAAQTSATWDQVVAAAQKEGRVTVYSGYVSPTTNEAIIKAFETKYGIKVDLASIRGAELRERVRMEQATGNIVVDVLHNAISQSLLASTVEKSLAPMPPLPNTARLKPEFKARANEFMVPIFTINYGILANNNLVTPDEAPKGWQDLLDPKWKGKILSDDPRQSGGGRVLFHMSFDRFGKEFHDKMATQDLTFVREYNEAARRVARGEYAMYIPFILSMYKSLEGLPLRYILPTEGSSYGSYAVSIAKNAPHPNAARLLADFYLSDEVQLIYAKTGHGIALEKLNETLPEDIQAIANVKPLAKEDVRPERVQELLDTAKTIYK